MTRIHPARLPRAIYLCLEQLEGRDAPAVAFGAGGNDAPAPLPAANFSTVPAMVAAPAPTAGAGAVGASDFFGPGYLPSSDLGAAVGSAVAVLPAGSNDPVAAIAPINVASASPYGAGPGLSNGLATTVTPASVNNATTTAAGTTIGAGNSLTNTTFY